MKIVTLNMWCGKMPDKLLGFVRANCGNIDVFCFQEVLDNEKGVKSAVFKDGTEDIIASIKEELKGYNAFVAIPQKNERGLATFIKNDWKVDAVEDQYVYGGKDTMVDNSWSTIGINMLYTRISREETYSIWNLHGKFIRMDKQDTEETIEQSNNIKRIIGSAKGKRILCGDFNLDPKTTSMSIIESIPLRNLIKEYGIKSTRPGFFDFPQKYADYIMPSKDIKVNDFKVMDDVVSDHLPLYFDCT